MTLKLKEKRIFIVEDNPQNRAIYHIMLMSQGAKIEFDRWGRDTLRKMQGSTRYDLIILDLMLPHGESGFDIFQKIREVPEFADIPVVAVSASEPAIAMPKAQQLGFSGFIAKPINADLFPGQLAQIIAGEKVWYAGEHFENID